MFLKREIRVVLMTLTNGLEQVSEKGHGIFTHLCLEQQSPAMDRLGGCQQRDKQSFWIRPQVSM